MKNILFITGTRADYGKIKPLMAEVKIHKDFYSKLFVTGMHLQDEFGNSKNEIELNLVDEVVYYKNHKESMDLTLIETINGLNKCISLSNFDMIVVHGDRVEALAGAIVGALRNIKVSHIEGGEVSGTIDDSIRHSISKLSHLHFVSNLTSKRRLIQLGEDESTIHTIGSPDIDIMISENLPHIVDIKNELNIKFEHYGIFLYHPVTTNTQDLKHNIKNIFQALNKTLMNFIVVYPNNDTGSDIIIKEIRSNQKNNNFHIFKNINFEYFLVLLKNASCIVGNSSSGVREAPIYGIPTINLGTRQSNRTISRTVHHYDEDQIDLSDKIKHLSKIKYSPYFEFGNGNSGKKFIEILSKENIWKRDIQKKFLDFPM